jgi:hypothetical protein
MSISKLVVNIQRAFAAGMVYVALSRCTSRDGLQVRGDSLPWDSRLVADVFVACAGRSARHCRTPENPVAKGAQGGEKPTGVGMLARLTTE